MIWWTWLILWFGSAGAVALYSALGRGQGAVPLQLSLASPSWSHIFGCGVFGQDMLFEVLSASAKSSIVSLIATALACLFALAIGGGIALLPERFRFVALRGLDAWLAFPFLLVALGLAAIRGPGWSTLIASLLIGMVPMFARLVYARTREILTEPFIEAAQSVGASSWRILIRHIGPNLGPLVVAKAPLFFAQCLMAEAALSYLGVGAPIGTQTWGSLLASGKDYLIEAPHIALASGIPLVLTLLALQILSAGKKSVFR
ncbi:MAG: ABC transporter permease [Oligoflexia bacterium]|nr:ABC transporter permease [Oligoflexia bacterium]